MTPRTRPSRVAEWAALVGCSVPEAALDADEPSTSGRSTRDAT
ncbi:hypothetical protein [Salinigranum marinum]|nr:hypothetical protein [Salinigranum marinum]